MNRRPVIRRMLGVSAHYDAVHQSPAKHIDVCRFAMRRVGGGTQQRLQSLPRQYMLQACGKRGKKRMPDRRHDDADRIGAILREIARKIVRHIMQRLHGALHAIMHVVGNVTRAIDHQRHGAQRDTGLFRHIAHSYHICLVSTLIYKPDCFRLDSRPAGL